MNAGYDIIQFEGISSTDVIFSSENGNLVIQLNDGSLGRVVITGDFIEQPGGTLDYGTDVVERIEELQFSDTTILLKDGLPVQNGDANNNTLTGSVLSDTIFGEGGNDRLHGGSGNDTLYGGSENDTLYGDGGDDLLSGGAGADFLTGNWGDDTLDGGAGDDDLYGGTDDDIYIFDAGYEHDTASESANEGNDTIKLTSWNANDVYIYVDGGRDLIIESVANPNDKFEALGKHKFQGFLQVGTDIVEKFETIEFADGSTIDLTQGVTMNLADNGGAAYGSELSDTVYGNSGGDTIFGFGENDTLQGGLGNDFIDGGAGFDTAVYLDVYANYSINTGNNTIEDLDTVSHGDEGEDDIYNIEYLQFADGTFDVATQTFTPAPPPNAAPVAADDDFTSDKDVILTGNLLADNENGADYDPESGPLSVVAGIYSTTNGGIVDLSANGDFTYTPVAGFTGADDFSYTLEDGNGGSDTGQVNLTINDVPTEQVMMEFGSVSTDHLGTTVNLSHTFVDPIVFVTMTTSNHSGVTVPRLTDVQSDSFTLYAQEADYLDGIHGTETFSYIVVEKGSWELSDGTKLEVGTTDTNLLAKNGFADVSFDTSFASTPTVLTQVQTNNDTDMVGTRQRNSDANGFDVAMIEQEDTNTGSHGTETIGWFAIEQGIGADDGHDFVAGSTGDTFTHSFDDILFDSALDVLPQLLANISSHDGGDASFVGARNLSQNSVEVKVAEDQSKDSETNHTTETFDYFAIEGSGALTGTDTSTIV